MLYKLHLFLMEWINFHRKSYHRIKDFHQALGFRGCEACEGTACFYIFNY
jgi:hypothetical protein